MKGYIPMAHYHYDETIPAEEPTVVYADRSEAEAIANRVAPLSSGVTGLVWEVIVPGVVKA